MAAENDPILPNPPAKPFEVSVTNDLPPWNPIEVPIFPDPLPWEPIEVSVTLDSPPWSPIPVQVSPDGGPWTPVEVGVTVDPGPWSPTPVDILPDPGPRNPTPVSVNLDDAPRPPVPVDVTLDPVPRAPFPVEVVPVSPPFSPIPVNVTEDSPPRAVLPVDVIPDPGPRPPFSVDVTPDPPIIQIPWAKTDTPTVADIIRAVGNFDSRLGTFLSRINLLSETVTNSPGGSALDPTALAAWFRDYMENVGSAGVGRFIAEQTQLYAMNPRIMRVFDPLYFLRMAVPGSMGWYVPALDLQGGVDSSDLIRADDTLLTARVLSAPDGFPENQRPNLYTPNDTHSDGQAISVDSLVNAALNIPGEVSPFVRIVDGITRFDSSRFFQERRPDGSMPESVAAVVRARSQAEDVSRSRLAASAATDGIIRASVRGEGPDGTVLSNTQDPSEVVDDDDARVPIVITDIRQLPNRLFRSIYFRPLNIDFSFGFSPEFSNGSGFGRVDPIVGYQGTGRNVSLSFDVIAMCPEDLTVIYQKMHWLNSMVYPSYDSNSLIVGGPIVRLRIGDVLATDLGGVPGIIKSLGYQFTEQTWELARGHKVPRGYKVSIEFLVLHDGPVGNVNGTFGVFRLPLRSTGRDLNFAGDPPSNGRSDTVTPVRGQFNRFGEPRRG